MLRGRSSYSKILEVEPLDLVLERSKGQPLDVARFLRLAIALTKAIGPVEPRLALGLEQ